MSRQNPIASILLWLGLVLLPLAGCNQVSPASGGSVKFDRQIGPARAAIALDGNGDNVYVVVNLAVPQPNVVLCVAPKADCARDDAPVINLIFAGNGSLRSEQLVNLQNGLEMHVMGGGFPREFIRSVRFRSRIANNQQGSLSLGSGGQTGNFESDFEFNGSNSKYKIAIPEDVQTGRYGMLVYLHGDGAGDYSSFWNSTKQISSRHNMIAVHVLAPTGNENGKSWWIAGESNADFLNALLNEQILQRYNIDKSRVVFSGQSGGPTFMTGTWMNKYAHQFSGGAVLMCGGLLRTSTTMEASNDWRRYFKLRIETTSSDFLNPGAHGAQQRFEGYGMDVQLTTHGDGSHCRFDKSPAEILEQRVAELM